MSHLQTRSLAVALLSLSLVASCESDECASSSDCNDGLFCNGDETCVSGRCLPAGLRDCNDNLTCTTDSCDEASGQCLHVSADLDGDGYYAPGCDGDDCDDSNPSIFPGAEEICNGLDDDCDGTILEDQDGDGHYDELLCPGGDDCDDSDPAVFLGAPEICDGVDNNCLSGVDDEADTDGDGAIDETCGGDDCDDEDASVSPSTVEICNGVDDNCDEEPDDGFDCIQGELYTCETSCRTLGTISCSAECTLSIAPEDCEPPLEACNGEDDDCDGVIDNDLYCAVGDLTDCYTPCGSVGTGLCTASCEPAAPEDCLPPAEQCNGLDDNCNGVADEGFLCAAGAEAICETTCGSLGTGFCTDSCGAAAPEDCTPPFETCYDLLDNDCDGDVDCTDEDCLGDISCGA